MALTIVIVGAGLTGLAAAITLSKKGHNVQVLEKASSLRTAGGVILIWPNGTRFFMENGMGNAAEPHTHEMKVLGFYRYASGGQLAKTTVLHPGQPFPHWLVKREDLQAVLYDAALANGAVVSFNKTVKTVDEDKPAVHLDDGTSVHADLIIAADGIKSHIRAQILGKDAQQPIINDLVAFLARIPRHLVEKDPDIRHLFSTEGEFHICMGPGRWFLVYPMPQKDFLGISCGDATYGLPAKVNHWNGDGDPKELCKSFEMFAPQYRRLLTYVTECDKWQIADGPPVDRWTSNNGRIIVMGDAAHAMLPHVGQGANQCFEDAAAIAEFLDDEVLDAHNDLGELTRTFEKLRKWRTDIIRDKAKDQADFNILPDGPRQEQRDSALKAMMHMPPPPPWDDVVADPSAIMQQPGWQKWLQGYDIVQEARTAARNPL